MAVKENKTKVMCASRRERDIDFIDLGGLMLEVVDSFRYLGSTITMDNNMTEEIKIRIAGASKCCWAIKSIIGSKILSRSTKIQAYVAIIRPIATYACETWSMTHPHRKKVQMLQSGDCRGQETSDSHKMILSPLSKFRMV